MPKNSETKFFFYKLKKNDVGDTYRTIINDKLY